MGTITKEQYEHWKDDQSAFEEYMGRVDLVYRGIGQRWKAYGERGRWIRTGHPARF